MFMIYKNHTHAKDYIYGSVDKSKSSTTYVQDFFFIKKNKNSQTCTKWLKVIHF